MLKIVMGTAKSGKTHYIFDEISAHIHKNRGHQVILIVPEQFTLEAERQLINHLDADGIIGVDVLSFKRLSYRVFNELGRFRGTSINELGKIMILKDVFEKHQSELKIFQKAYNKNGFLDQFHDLITELKQNRISPEMLKEELPFIENDQALFSKISDLIIIYESYETYKEQQFMDDEDEFELFIEKIGESEKIKNSDIWFDGFDSFNGQEYEILKSLAHYANSVTLTLTGDGKNEDGIFNHTDRLYKKLMTSVDIKTGVIQIESDFLNDRLRHFSKNLLVYPYEKKIDDHDNIVLFAAQNYASEVEHCAIEIVKLIQDKVCSWRDIAVVTNNLEAYHMPLIRVFETYHIPFFIDEKRSTLSNPLILLFQSLKDGIENGFQSETVIRMLKTQFFPLDFKEIGYLENYILANGIKNAMFFKPFTRNKDNSFDLERLEIMRIKCFEPLKSLYESTSERELRLESRLMTIYNTLLLLDVPTSLAKKIDILKEKGYQDSAQEVEQIWPIFIGIMEQLVALLGEEIMSLNEAMKRLEVGIEAAEIGILPLSEQHVLIGSLDRSKSHEIKVLFLLGVNDGVIPEIGADHQLLLDSEKEILVRHGLNWISDEKMFMDKETFNIYNALTRPSEKLYLSFAYADGEGRALRPSQFVGKAKKIAPKLKIEYDQIYEKNPLEKISNRYGTFNHLIYQIRMDLEGHHVANEWYDVMQWYRENDPKRVAHVLTALQHSNTADNIEKNKVKALYNLPLKTSVSKLETFIKCPFKHFVDSGLKPIKSKRYEINYPDVGILFHESLQSFGNYIYNHNLDWTGLDQVSCQRIMEGIVESMVDSDLYRSKFQYQYLIQKLKRVSNRAVWTLTQHLKQGHFKPEAFELEFSDGEKGVPPIFIELSNGELLMIRGVIDRVDVMENATGKYLKVIDYKSGFKELSFSDIYNGLEMQLMVYMEACMDHPEYFSATHLFPAGIFYYHIDDPMINSAEVAIEKIEMEITNSLKMDGISIDQMDILRNLDDQLFETSKSTVIPIKIKKDGNYTQDSKVMEMDGFKALMAHVKTTIESAGVEITEGNISISPCKTSKYTNCDYCDYQGICQFDLKLKGNVFREIKEYKKDEVIDIVSRGDGDE